MLALIALPIGAIWGAFLAKKRGGNRLDMLQYAAGFAIAFFLLTVVLSIAFARYLEL